MKKIIFFDVDSTLVTIEGLDFIAQKKGKRKEVKILTDLAMSGKVKMEEVFGKKVDLLAPSQIELENLADVYKTSLVSDAFFVINSLQKNGFEVGIITGNFLPAVLPLANYLGIAPSLVFANDIYFQKNGEYKDFNRNHPLARSGGKAEIVQQFKDAQIIFVGDSATDLETKPFVNLFIGFGGVVERQKVKNEAKRYIYRLSEIVEIVEKG